MESVDVGKRYNLPSTVRFCTRCVISNQRPRKAFDEHVVCNACRYWERKRTEIDWPAREQELQKLCDRFRRNDGTHDVVVPSSGGKDSCFVAHQLKYQYGMNPLTVTWAPAKYTDIGRNNFYGLVDSGLDNVLGSPNGIVHRRMTRICFEEMGEPFQPFIYGQVGFPVRIALGYGIQLIMDGENGEVEYGGDPSSDKPGFTISDIDKYWFSSHPLTNWLDQGFSNSDLAHYMPPDLSVVTAANIERHFFSYYKNWTPQEHYYYAAEHCGFKANPDGRSEGTFSKYASLDDQLDGYHYYLMLLKFGIGRATSDAAHEIREGLITREEGVALVHRFDQEFPQKYFQNFLEYCDMSEAHFWEVCERWRNSNLWLKDGNRMKLRVQVS